MHKKFDFNFSESQTEVHDAYIDIYISAHAEVKTHCIIKPSVNFYKQLHDCTIIAFTCFMAI